MKDVVRGWTALGGYLEKRAQAVLMNGLGVDSRAQGRNHSSSSVTGLQLPQPTPCAAI